MTRVVDRFTDVLKRAVELLTDCELYDQASWFNDRLDLVRDPESDVAAVAAEVRSIIAGMGSFSDLSLQPAAHSRLSETQALELKWNLADEMDGITGQILNGSNETGMDPT